MKIKVRREPGVGSMFEKYMQKANKDTTERVRKALKKLSKSATAPSTSIVIAIVPSSKKGKPPYKIRLAGNAVLCPCDGFRYRNQCRHMDTWREHMAEHPTMFTKTGCVI